MAEDSWVKFSSMVGDAPSPGTSHFPIQPQNRTQIETLSPHLRPQRAWRQHLIAVAGIALTWQGRASSAGRSVIYMVRPRQHTGCTLAKELGS